MLGSYVAVRILYAYCGAALCAVLAPTALTGTIQFLLEAIVASAMVLIVARAHVAPAWWTLLVCAACGLYACSMFRCGSSELAEGLIILVLVSGCKMEDACKAYAVTGLVTMSAVMALTAFGVLYNRDVIPNDRLVFSFGLGHPNTAGVLLFSALAALTYSHWSKRQWAVPAALSAIAALFSYVVLSSHAATVLLACLGVANLVEHTCRVMYSSFACKFVLVLSFAMPLLLFAFMVFGMVRYDAGNELWIRIDRALHGRILFAHKLL